MNTRWLASAVAAWLLLQPALGCKRGSKKKATADERSKTDAKLVDAANGADARVVTKKPRRAMLLSIGIVPEHPEKPVEIYAERLAKQLGMQLTSTKWFGAETRPLPKGVAAHDATLRLRINYDYELDKRTNILVTMVAVVAEVYWKDGDDGLQPGEKVLLKRTFTKEQRSMDVAEHVAAQISDTVRLAGAGLIDKAALLEADRDRLLIVMGKLDEDIVIWALTIAGQRKIKSLFDTVVGLLGHKLRSVREAAVGCLIELGDRRAVAHLTKLAKFKDHRLLTIVIDAVAALGGDEAKEFLAFLSSGHGNTKIRAQAAQARKRIDLHHKQ